MGNENLQSTKDLAEAIETLAGHGKDLAEIEGATKVLRKLSKVSAGLGLLGVGFDIVLSLLPSGPSVDDKILAAVNALSSKIDVLWGRLESEFEDLEANNALRAAKSGISEEISAFRTLGQSVHYRNFDELRKIGTFEVRKWVNNLADHALGSAVHENIFKAVYECTHGNLDQMTSTGGAMVDCAIVALIATGMIRADQWHAEQRTTSSPPEEQIARQRQELDTIFSALEPAVIIICDEFAVWQQRCVDEAEANISRFFERLSPKLDDLKGIGSDMGRTGAGHIATEANYRIVAEDMVKDLKRNWSWCDWLVIVGQPTSAGSKNFGYQELLDNLAQDFDEDEKKTIIYKVDLDRKNRNGMRSSVLIAARPKTRKSKVSARSFAEHLKDTAEGKWGFWKEFSGVRWEFKSHVHWSAAWSEPVNIQVGIVTNQREGESTGRVHFEKAKGGWDALLWGSYPQ